MLHLRLELLGLTHSSLLHLRLELLGLTHSSLLHLRLELLGLTHSRLLHLRLELLGLLRIWSLRIHCRGGRLRHPDMATLDRLRTGIARARPRQGLQLLLLLRRCRQRRRRCCRLWGWLQHALSLGLPCELSNGAGDMCVHIGEAEQATRFCAHERAELQHCCFQRTEAAG